MATYPRQIRTELQRSSKTGLFAAISPDLPGLMVVARTIEEVEDRIPSTIADLIEAEYGEKVVVTELGSETGEDFRSLADPRIMELKAA